MSAEKSSKKEKIPKMPNPNQIAMGGGKDGGDRPASGQPGALDTTPVRDRTATDEQFPTNHLTSEHPKDEVMTEKLELQAKSEAKGTPGVTDFGVLKATDEDFKYMADKREMEYEAAFDQWFAVNFDKMAPEQKQLARHLFSKFYDRRIANLDNNINLLRTIAHVKVRGAQDKDDLLLLFAVESGLIDTDFLENILHPERVAASQNKAIRQANYNRGLFSPKRLVRGDWGPNTREQNATKAVGRKAGAFGYKPWENGVNGNPFSMIGTVDEQQEKQSNFRNQLGAMGFP